MTLPRPTCPHCGAPVRAGRGVLCDPSPPALPVRVPDCRALVVDAGHPTACDDCEGYGGGEDWMPGLIWMERRFGVPVDATEVATW